MVVSFLTAPSQDRNFALAAKRHTGCCAGRAMILHHLLGRSSLVVLAAAGVLGCAAVACSSNVVYKAGPGGGDTDGSAGDTDGGTDVDGGPDGGGYVAPDGLIAVPLSSCTPTSFTAGVNVGTQNFQLSIDTGSTSLGVASASCSGCGVTPSYTPGSTATDEKMQTTSQYASGSWTGEVYQDTVTVGPSPSVALKFAAIQSQDQFFEPVECDSKSGGTQGIIGLGPAGAAVDGTNGFLDVLLMSNTSMQNVFATELCDNNGTLWLGGYDPAFTTGAAQYTPLDPNYADFAYAINFDSITVNGTTTKVATGQYTSAIVDTGTSVFILPTAVLNAVSASIATNATFKSLFGSAEFLQQPGSCASITQTKAELDASLPPLTLTFGSISIQAAPTESYLVPFGGQWCSAMDANDPSADFPIIGILGAPILRSNVVIWDRAQKRVGFAPHKACAVL
jgi:hypothetical protein